MGTSVKTDKNHVDLQLIDGQKISADPTTSPTSGVIYMVCFVPEIKYIKALCL